jgi:Lon protease-like protein
MHTTSPTTNTWTKAATVIVDWSQQKHDTQQEETMEVAHLMNWIRTYPARTAVHVYLRRMPLQKNRLLQNTLQSLGCKVTLRDARIATEEVSTHLNQTAAASFF